MEEANLGEPTGLGIPVGEGSQGALGNGGEGESEDGLPGACQTPPQQPWKHPGKLQSNTPFLHIWGHGIRVRDQCPLPLPDSA